MSDLTTVQSSAVSQVGYERDTKLLTVVWKHGETTRYRGVPPYVHAGLMKAKSIGRYVKSHIVGVYEVAGGDEPPVTRPRSSRRA